MVKNILYMGLNFRKRIKVIPGVYLNISKSGISTSMGVKGARITFGKKGIYTNIGIPGTGFYSRKKISSSLNSTTLPDPYALIRIDSYDKNKTIPDDQNSIVLKDSHYRGNIVGLITLIGFILVITYNASIWLYNSLTPKFEIGKFFFALVFMMVDYFIIRYIVKILKSKKAKKGCSR